MNCKARVVRCQYDSFLLLQLASRHDNLIMKLVSQSLVGRAVGPSLGSSWLYYTLLLHARNYYQTVNAVSSGSGVITDYSFILLRLGLTVTEISIKKVQKQDLKIH